MRITPKTIFSHSKRIILNSRIEKNKILKFLCVEGRADLGVNGRNLIKMRPGNQIVNCQSSTNIPFQLESHRLSDFIRFEFFIKYINI